MAAKRHRIWRNITLCSLMFTLCVLARTDAQVGGRPLIRFDTARIRAIATGAVFAKYPDLKEAGLRLEPVYYGYKSHWLFSTDEDAEDLDVVYELLQSSSKPRGESNEYAIVSLTVRGAVKDVRRRPSVLPSMGDPVGTNSVGKVDSGTEKTRLVDLDLKQIQFLAVNAVMKNYRPARAAKIEAASVWFSEENPSAGAGEISVLCDFLDTAKREQVLRDGRTNSVVRMDSAVVRMDTSGRVKFVSGRIPSAYSASRLTDR
jgi:hypothetical protein